MLDRNHSAVLPRPVDCSLVVGLLALVLSCRPVSAEDTRPTDGGGIVRLRLRITTPLKFPNTPIDPVIDFSGWTADAGLTGVADPNSVEVINSATGRIVPHAMAEDFAYTDSGRVEFVAEDS